MWYAKRFFIVLLAVLAIALLVAVVHTAGAAGGAAVSPSPSPSTTASSEPTSTPVLPASYATVKHVRHLRIRATQSAREYNCYRRCFLFKPIAVHGGPRPLRSEPEVVWRDAGRFYSRLIVRYTRATAHLHSRMVSTKGGGALRWRPLIRYWWPEWNESQVYLMAHIIWHESSGSPYRWNMAGSGAFGLFQLLPRPPGVWSVWTQARAARQIKYDHGGLGHWAGSRGFSCSGGCGIY